MPQPQHNIDVAAPGFMGLNLEESPTALGPEWAAVANHCVLDEEGRIGSRKGLAMNIQETGVLIETISEFVAENGDTTLFSAGGLNIYRGYAAPLIPLTFPVDYVVTDNNWQMIQFNNRFFFVQKDHQMLMYNPTSTTPDTLEAVDTAAAPVGPDDAPNCGTAGEGHLWVGGFPSAEQWVFWSGLLDGTDFVASDSGQLNLSEAWPNGHDEVVGIIVHNANLYIFGRVSILVYSGAGDPTNELQLVDTINRIGCVARDSIVALGRDIYFLDANGVRSMARTIQEKSVPIGDVSANVDKDIEALLIRETEQGRIRAEYSPENFFYVIIFPTSETVYVFDTRGKTESGGARATLWPSMFGPAPRCCVRTKNQQTFFGGQDGIYRYEGSVDVLKDFALSTVDFKYRLHPQTFGEHVTVKFPKQVDVVFFGGLGQCLKLSWAFDYREPAANQIQNCFIALDIAEYNIGQYGIDEYSGDNSFISETKYNVWGSGKRVTYELSMNVDKQRISIQELNLQALKGRIL